MAKNRVKIKKEVEKEIEVIKNSQETDKFDYSLHWNTHIAFISIVTALWIGALTIGITTNRIYITIITSIAWFLVVIGRWWYIRREYISAIERDFKNKKRMLQERYSKIGVDIISLNKELGDLNQQEQRKLCIYLDQKYWTPVVGVATVLALVIGSWSLIISVDSVYGPSDLILEYTKSGINDKDLKYYFYDSENNLLKFEFLVKNVGHGSTAFSIQPTLPNCGNCPFEIIYNGNEPINIRGRPIDIKSINAKSTTHIMIAFKDVIQEYPGELVGVRLRDASNNDKDTLIFQDFNSLSDRQKAEILYTE